MVGGGVGWLSFKFKQHRLGWVFSRMIKHYIFLNMAQYIFVKNKKQKIIKKKTCKQCTGELFFINSCTLSFQYHLQCCQSL